MIAVLVQDTGSIFSVKLLTPKRRVLIAQFAKMQPMIPLAPLYHCSKYALSHTLPFLLKSTTRVSDFVFAPPQDEYACV